MNIRNGTAIAALVFQVVPFSLLLYAKTSGDSVGAATYGIVQAIGPWVSVAVGEVLAGFGSHVASWWWVWSFGAIGVSTLAATVLAIADSTRTVLGRIIWVVAFLVAPLLAVPLFCILQISGRAT